MSTHKYFGIDIHPIYQDVTDWNAVAKAVDFCIIKVSDGGAPYTKRRPDAYAAEMRKRRNEMGIGAYHYAQFSPAPEVQADILIQEAERLGLTDIAYVCDLEAPFSPNSTAKNFGIRFCNRIHSRGRKPGIYMSKYFAQTLRPDTWNIPNLWIWIAAYGSDPYYGGNYDAHQYSSSGTVPGINSRTDVNRAYNDNLWAKQREEPDMSANGPENWDSADFSRLTNWFQHAPMPVGPKLDDGTYEELSLKWLLRRLELGTAKIVAKLDAMGSGEAGELTLADLQTELQPLKDTLTVLRGLLPGE